MVIRAQEDKPAVMRHIAELLQRLARLYAVPDFKLETAVDLAEWIMEAYNCEPLELITKVLRNPPATDKPNWRLTPDTIRLWMADALEKQAEEFERQHEKQKKLGNEELPNVDYESFKHRLEAGDALQEPKKVDEGYNAYKSERARQIALQNKPQQNQ